MFAWLNQLFFNAESLVKQASEVSQSLFILVILLFSVAIVADAVIGRIQKMRKLTGISRHMVIKSLDAGKFILSKEYISPKLGLAGKPDAIVLENKFYIPIERKAFGKRPRDRDIAQLLVYLRLVEECEGIRPPHGYIIMGPNAQRFKIDNTEARQIWLSGILDKMREIINGGECHPDPHPKKCPKCTVSSRCNFKII